MKQIDQEYEDFKASVEKAIADFGVIEIAEKYGCTESYVYQIAQGKRAKGKRSQIKFSESLGMTYRDFLNYGTPTTDPQHIPHQPQPEQNLIQNLEMCRALVKAQKEIISMKDMEIARLETELAEYKTRLEEQRATGSLPNVCPSCKREAS